MDGLRGPKIPTAKSWSEEGSILPAIDGSHMSRWSRAGMMKANAAQPRRRAEGRLRRHAASMRAAAARPDRRWVNRIGNWGYLLSSSFSPSSKPTFGSKPRTRRAFEVSA